MSVDPVIIKADISEEARRMLQESILKDTGKIIQCSKCRVPRHILDLNETVFKLGDVAVLRYLCPVCEVVIVEAADGDYKVNPEKIPTMERMFKLDPDRVLLCKSCNNSTHSRDCRVDELVEGVLGDIKSIRRIYYCPCGGKLLEVTG